MGYPGALVQPIQPSELVTSAIFMPVARRASQGGGVLLDHLYFGAFNVAYDVSLASEASEMQQLTSELEIRLCALHTTGTLSFDIGILYHLLTDRRSVVP